MEQKMNWLEGKCKRRYVQIRDSHTQDRCLCLQLHVLLTEGYSEVFKKLVTAEVFRTVVYLLCYRS